MRYSEIVVQRIFEYRAQNYSRIRLEPLKRYHVRVIGQHHFDRSQNALHVVLAAERLCRSRSFMKAMYCKPRADTDGNTDISGKLRIGA